MTKISNKIAYVIKSQIADDDFILGTNSEELSNIAVNDTVNFPLKNIKSYIIGSLSPDAGGLLKITEFIPTTILTEIATIVNNLFPIYVVGRYENVFFNINGNIYLLKSQNITIGLGENMLSNTDFILISKFVDGSETKITAGSNTTVTGDGKTLTPYVINATNTTYTAGTGMSLTGNQFNCTVVDTNTTYTAGTGMSLVGTQFNCTVVNTDTTYTAGSGLSLIGTQFNIVNLQKVISSNYTLQNSDNGFLIFVNNGLTNITITIDTSVTLDNFEVGFIQEGTGLVTLSGVGVTLTNPIGFKIKGQGENAFLARKLNTLNYYLLGETKI